MSRVGPLRSAAGLRARFTAFLAGGSSGDAFDLTLPEEGGERRLRVRFGRVCADIVIVRISESGRNAGDRVL